MIRTEAWYQEASPSDELRDLRETLLRDPNDGHSWVRLLRLFQRTGDRSAFKGLSISNGIKQLVRTLGVRGLESLKDIFPMRWKIGSRNIMAPSLLRGMSGSSPHGVSASRFILINSRWYVAWKIEDASQVIVRFNRKIAATVMGQWNAPKEVADLLQSEEPLIGEAHDLWVLRGYPSNSWNAGLNDAEKSAKYAIYSSWYPGMASAESYNVAFYASRVGGPSLEAAEELLVKMLLDEAERVVS